MFDYTILTLRNTLNDIKRVYYVSTFATQILYIIYLIYAIIANTGILFTNICMLVLSVGYFIFFILSLAVDGVKKNKRVKKQVKGYYKLIKHAIQLVVIAVSVYNLSQVSTESVTIPMLLCAVMIFSFIIQVLLEVMVAILTARFNLLKEALAADFEFITKPLGTAGDFIKKLKGDAPAEKKAPTKTRVLLDGLVSKYRAKKAIKKDAPEADGKSASDKSDNSENT